MDLEWISVKDDSPPIQKPYKNLSREVDVLTGDGRILVAFFNYNRDEWHDANTIKKIKGVQAWRDR